MVIEANKIPKKVIEKLLILKESSSLFSISLEKGINRDCPLKLPLTNCFEFVNLKSLTC